MWKTFWKRNKVWLSIFVICFLMQGFFGYLWKIPRGDCLYFIGLEGFIIIVGIVTEGFRYIIKVKKLERISQSAIADKMELPEVDDAVEQAYSDIVENVNAFRRRMTGDLAKSQQEMQEYYAMWVHQIKTPIAAMRLLFQIEKMQLESEETNENTIRQLDMIAEAEEGVFRIEEYVAMALQYQRIQSDGNDLVVTYVELDRVIREAIHKYAKMMIRKKIRIIYEGTEQKVLTDEKWIRFVMEQILSNAVKYTEKGSITIDTKMENNTFFVCIKDTGIGIRREDLPRVFERGYTGYNGHENRSSTGIGLYLTRKMLEKLGHSIRMDSEVGSGTSVWVGFLCNLTIM